MTHLTLEVVAEDPGLYAIACDAGETLGVIGPMDDRDAIMAAAVERWPNIDHIDLDAEILRAIDAADGDDSAAREHLAAGFPIYYREAETPPGLLVKKYPDGRRELVRFNRAGDEVIRAL